MVSDLRERNIEFRLADHFWRRDRTQFSCGHHDHLHLGRNLLVAGDRRYFRHFPGSVIPGRTLLSGITNLASNQR